MLVPLYGFLQGDTIGMLVLVHDHEPVDAIAEKMRQYAKVRLAVTEPLKVIYKGELLIGEETIAARGIQALDRVDVVKG
jgi:hypothetical protein